jgi:plastocyanin
MTDGNEDLSRRAFLRTATGAAAASAAVGTAAAQEESGGGGSTKTVTVGPGGQLVFEP